MDMTNNSWEGEFDRAFFREGWIPLEKVTRIQYHESLDDIKSFIKQTLEQAVAEERGRVREEIRRLVIYTPRVFPNKIFPTISRETVLSLLSPTSECCEKCKKYEVRTDVIGLNHVPMKQICEDSGCVCHTPTSSDETK